MILAFQGRPAPSAAQRTLALHVGIVQAGETICHVSASPTQAGLSERLGEYVREQATYQLWPEEAERVLELLAEGRTEAAVELYFARIGPRWGEERLAVTRIEVPLPQALRAARPGGSGDPTAA